MAVDTLDDLYAACVTPADQQERSHVGELTAAVQKAIGDNVEVAFVDQGYTEEDPVKEGAAHGLRLEMVKHTAAKRGFVLLPGGAGSLSTPLRGPIVFAGWCVTMKGFPSTGFQFVAFANVMLSRILSNTTPQRT